MTELAPPFLTAEWRYLAMLNYAVSPDRLLGLVPAGTELDTFCGVCYVSVVGFLFRDTRVRGIPVPFHRNFEEVNLRFYVRREVNGEVRRAVTFIREFVPRRAIAFVARAAYNEPYRAVPMRHALELSSAGVPQRVVYKWRIDGQWTSVVAETSEPGAVPPQDSEEAFITEHYWGYTRQRDASTVEYEVRHPRWRVWKAHTASLDGAVERSYGTAWAVALAGAPASAFVADGSTVSVYPPRRLL